MTTKKLFFSLVITVLALTACQKDLDLFVPDPTPGPDSTWYNTISNTMPVSTLRADLLLDIHSDSFSLINTVANISAASGLNYTFTPGTLVNNSGQPVSGKIYLESYLLKKKGDMIRMGTPTTSNGRILVSGGELFTRLMKDGVELQLSTNAQFNISYTDNPVSQSMNLFVGDESNLPAFNWLPLSDTFNQVTALAQSYQVLTNRLRWLNCDYFYDTVGIPQTIVSAVLPSNYTNANTMAYLVFDDMRSVIGMYGNATTRKFISGKLPANNPVTLIVISKQGDDYFLGHQQATLNGSPGTVANQQITVTPVITSLDNIKAYLETL